MMRLCLCLLALCCLLWPLPLFAQQNYAWQAGDLALTYPADWAQPQEDGDRLILRAAEIALPGTPTIVLTRESLSADLYTTLQTTFNDWGVIPSGPLEGELAGFPAILTSGSSASGGLYALGRIAQLSDGTALQIVGTVAASERDAFTLIFDDVADSIALGAGSTPRLASSYGVLWYTAAAGEQPLTGLAGLAYADGRVYTLDSVLGIVQLDAATGAVLDTFTHSLLAAPSDIALDAAGNIYITDLACGCVLSGTDDIAFEGLSSLTHISIAVTPGGQIFTADDNGLQIDGRPSAAPPGLLLALDNRQQLLALDSTGTLWTLRAGTLEQVAQLTDLPAVNDFTVSADNHLLLATATQGILIYDLDGQQIGRVGRVVPAFPLPGELVAPAAVAVSPDTTLFWADSGAVTAMSTRVQSGASGTLTLGRAVQGVLNDFTAQQTWTFVGAVGDSVTIAAIDVDSGLDVALRLLAPDGREEAYNDNHPGTDLPARTDAEILVHSLRASGTYFVRVERVSGAGMYRLGISEGLRAFDLSADGVTNLQGELQDVFPVQRWLFSGRAGQVFTITMMAESGDLDPLLRLRDSSGTLLAENDDAADPALGLDAQLLQVTLPADGLYVLEAVRFSGSGRYSLVLVTTSP